MSDEIPKTLTYTDEHGTAELFFNGNVYTGSVLYSTSTQLSMFSSSIRLTVAPLLEKSKDEIISSAPWIFRGPLKLSWPWITSTLLPILIKISIEAFLGQYGSLIATLISTVMPYIKSTLSDEIISTLERIHSLASSISQVKKTNA